MVFIVILAGGGGERLWPKSRKNCPKQCISLNGKQTLIQRTYELAVQISGLENVLISTRKELAKIIQKQIPNANMLIEPIGRDSAAGIGYVCASLLYKNIDDVTIFMGADYHIPDITRFKEVLDTAVLLAEQGKISAIGIKPQRVETRFGYIKPGNKISQTRIPAYNVIEFTEKPNEDLAREYIARGYLWNSGMFVSKPSILYQNINKYMPHLFQVLEQIKSSNFASHEAYKAFTTLSKVSIDYGVMEKTSDLVVVKGDFNWDDIGTWDSLDKILDLDTNGNIIQGDFMGIDVHNNIIFGEKPVIAYGIRDLVIIDTVDCVFVCSKDNARDVKKVINELDKHPKLRKLLFF